MPCTSNNTLDMDQDSSPRIEDEILDLLQGDLKESAMAFVAYLRANQMAPRQWFGPKYWRIPYGANFLCSIIINQGKWRVFFFAGQYQGQFEEGFIKAIHGSVMPCVACTGDDCPKGRVMTIFGKEFANTCFQFPIQFVNPDHNALVYIKDLMEYWKGIAPLSDSWHCR